MQENVPEPTAMSPLHRRTAIALFMTTQVCTMAFAADSRPTLHQRLGGQEAVVAVVDMLIERSRRDPRIHSQFEKVNFSRLKTRIALQLCALTGGGCTFDGDDMRATHAGLHITEGQFHALVEILREVLDEAGIATREKNELLALLAPMKRDVVTGPAARGDR
jgi:hemoglobin